MVSKAGVGKFLISAVALISAAVSYSTVECMDSVSVHESSLLSLSCFCKEEINLFKVLNIAVYMTFFLDVFKPRRPPLVLGEWTKCST